MGKLFAAELHRRKGAFMTSLRRRMTEDMQVRSLSPQTQATYLQQAETGADNIIVRPWRNGDSPPAPQGSEPAAKAQP
jgi:hypothetical protein